MKKIIFNKLILDVTKFFLLSSLSLSLIILVVQAVNFLDYVSEDGHGIYTYFGITILNFPKIFSRILPFCVFVTIFYIINKYEVKNELLIFWNIGVKKLKFINTLVIFSLFFLILQLILNVFIVPKSLDQAREFVRNSNIEFFPNLIKEKKFIDAVESLTLFVEQKKKNGELTNIYLKDNLAENQSQIIYAKKGKLVFNNEKNYLELFDGNFIDVDNKKITTFSFKKTEFDLSKYKTKTTIFPKVQELSTKIIFLCLYKLKIDKNYDLKSKFLKCNEETYSDVIEEAFKRGIKPLFIPLIVLVSSLVIMYNKDNYFYSKFQYLLFFIVLIIIILSEVSSRYIYDIRTTLLFSLLPIILFLIGYIFLIFRFREKL
ncbi:LptF/LptG family permease [Candidatus Pelagibacter sp.]|nr:LptF/LptG family permease [Candidatus Pelagibacter sp.]